MGVSDGTSGQLEPGDVAFAHARCAMVRTQPRLAPFHEPGLAHGEWRSAFPGSGEDDKANLAQCLCGRALCVASFARGIGRMGGRTEGCVEHFFWAALAV